MHPAKAKAAPRTRCQGCGRMAPKYDITQYGSPETGYRKLCSPCVSAEIARADGVTFEHLQFEPVEVTDSDGLSHLFHFRTHLFGPGVALDAFELYEGRPAGYQFQMIGQPDADLLALLAQLIAKIRRALALRHLADSPYGLQIADRTVRGAIVSDCGGEEAEPVLIVDGREITWQLLGKMLMTFEGFQFKLEIRDRSEEI